MGSPEAFEPSSDDWRLYAQRFEHFLLVNGIEDDSKRRHLLLALIGNSTFKLLTNLVAPKKPGELSYKEICEQLEKQFSPKPVKLAERFRFYNRRQHSEETVAEYLAELRKLAINCEFGNFLEDALCDRLVCGLKDEATQRRLLIEVDLSLKKAFEIIQGIEAAAKNAREIQSNGQQKSVELNAVTPREHSKHLSKNTVPTTHCPRCLGSGHEAAVCRFKTAKCRKCNKKGHIAKACKSEGQRPVQSGQTKH